MTTIEIQLLALQNFMCLLDLYSRYQDADTFYERMYYEDQIQLFKNLII